MSKRPIGRPKKRWEEDVLEDVMSMNVCSWRSVAQNRDGWKKVAEQARILNRRRRRRRRRRKKKKKEEEEEEGKKKEEEEEKKKKKKKKKKKNVFRGVMPCGEEKMAGVSEDCQYISTE